MSSNAAFRAYDQIEKGRNIVTATVVSTEGSSPRHAGSLMVFVEDGRHWGSVGGGKLEAAVTEQAMATFETRQRSNLFHYVLQEEGEDALGMACGGDADVLIEFFDASKPEELNIPLPVQETAYVFGCGHVGAALEPILRHIGFKTVMVDDRPEFADPALFPNASNVVALESYHNACSHFPIDEQSYIIVVTRGHKGDYHVVESALGTNAGYIGMIGSKRKTAATLDKLRENGFDEQRISFIHAPIGEKIYAETPEEISISIAAELVRVRSGH